MLVGNVVLRKPFLYFHRVIYPSLIKSLFLFVLNQLHVFVSLTIHCSLTLHVRLDFLVLLSVFFWYLALYAQDLFKCLCYPVFFFTVRSPVYGSACYSGSWCSGICGLFDIELVLITDLSLFTGLCLLHCTFAWTDHYAFIILLIHFFLLLSTELCLVCLF